MANCPEDWDWSGAMIGKRQVNVATNSVRHETRPTLPKNDIITLEIIKWKLLEGEIKLVISSVSVSSIHPWSLFQLCYIVGQLKSTFRKY